jgi:hypothetical protein
LILNEHPQSEKEVQLKRAFSIPLAIPPSILLHADEELEKSPASQPRRTRGGSPSSFAVLQLPRRESGTKAQPKLTAKPRRSDT